MCRRPLLWVGKGHRKSNLDLTRLTPESWKSARSQNVSQTIALGWEGAQKVESGLNSIGTGILEVCKKPECVADHCFGLRRVPGSRIRT